MAQIQGLQDTRKLIHYRIDRCLRHLSSCNAKQKVNHIFAPEKEGEIISALLSAGEALKTTASFAEASDPLIDTNKLDRLTNQAQLAYKDWEKVIESLGSGKSYLQDVTSVAEKVLLEEGFDCAAGATNIGVGCMKVKDTYARNIGDPLSSCPDGKEKSGALCYNKCRDGYNGLVSTCWQTCPSGFTDYGTGCSNLKIVTKKSYTRGAGSVLDSCPADKDKSGALCYNKCKSGYSGVANTCSKNCPSGYTDTGLTCTKIGDTFSKKVTQRSSRVPSKGPCASGERDDGTSCWSPLDCNTTGCGCIKKTLMDRTYCKKKALGICIKYGKRDCDNGQRDDGTSCWEDAKTTCTGGEITKTLADRQLPCNSDEETINTGVTKACFSKCPSGYKTVGTDCYQECPSGYTDTGLICTKADVQVKDVYLRDAGSPLGCGSNMEKDGALCYKTCDSGYSGKGPVCWQNCDDGFTDDGATCRRDNGFIKDTYQRDVGSPMVCSSNQEQQGALCYDKCRTNYTGVLNVCWENCPSGYTDTGIGCTQFSLEFIEDIKDLFEKIFGVIRDAFDRFADAVVRIWEKMETTVDKFASDVKEKMEDLWGILKPILEMVWYAIKYITDTIIFVTTTAAQTTLTLFERTKKLWIVTPILALGLYYGSHNLLKYLFNSPQTYPVPTIITLFLAPTLLLTSFEPLQTCQDFVAQRTIPLLYKNVLGRTILGLNAEDSDFDVIKKLYSDVPLTTIYTVGVLLAFKFIVVDTSFNLLQATTRYVTEGKTSRVVVTL